MIRFELADTLYKLPAEHNVADFPSFLSQAVTKVCLAHSAPIEYFYGKSMGHVHNPC